MTGAIYTLGHSTRPAEAFFQILAAFGIQALVDVRRYPKSRRNPQYNDDVLGPSLRSQGIDYISIPALGGRRKPEPESRNTGWQDESFRGYADYMQTPVFLENLETLMNIAQERKTVILCAEAVPWRCHRSLIADALLVRGWQVQDIFDAKTSRPHTLPAWARVEGQQLTYPPVEGSSTPFSAE